MNAARGRQAIRLVRIAIASYFQSLSFSSEPSPNQPPGAIPAKVIVFPVGASDDLLTSQSTTPIQSVTGLPFRIT
jgi:hypothetical protein